MQALLLELLLLLLLIVLKNETALESLVRRSIQNILNSQSIQSQYKKILLSTVVFPPKQTISHFYTKHKSYTSSKKILIKSLNEKILTREISFFFSSKPTQTAKIQSKK